MHKTEIPRWFGSVEVLPVALLALIATAVVMCFGSPVVDLDSFARAGSRCSAGMTVNHFAHKTAGLERIEHRIADMIAAVASSWTDSNATVSEKLFSTQASSADAEVS